MFYLKKRGISLTFNYIVVAALALVILIVMLAVYTGFIGRSSKDLQKPADEAGKEANDAAWCMQAYIRGQDCIEEDAESCNVIDKSGSCQPARADANGVLECSDTMPNHRIAGRVKDKVIKANSEAKRYCCCP